MQDTSRQDNTIEQFCLRLSQIEGHEVLVLERPDQDNPGGGGCDAIIQRGGFRFALEHTTIDSYSGQRADDDRFKRFIRLPLEVAVRSAYADSWIEIIVPANPLPIGMDWSQVRDSLREGCLNAIQGMPLSDDYVPFHFPCVPFPVQIMRSEDGSSPGCYLLREAPANLQRQLAADVGRAIHDKSLRLRRYTAQGFPIILLLDSDDTALVNRYSFAEAFSTAAQAEDTALLDEVFIAEAAHNPIWFFPVKLHQKIYPDLPEFERYRKAQYRMTYPSPSQG